MARSPLIGAAATAALALALAGCGSMTAAESASTSSAGTGSSSAGPSPADPVAASRLLCARPAAVSRVVIARAGIAPRIPQPVRGARPAGSAATPSSTATPVVGRPPAAMTVVTSAAKAQTLARTVCALPRFPREPVNCPALVAGFYRLTFTADGRQLPVVTVQDTGCQTVTGLGMVRTAAGRVAFWKVLDQLAGQPIQLPVHLPGNPGGPMRPMS
jgi:hypothetical protein